MTDGGLFLKPAPILLFCRSLAPFHFSLPPKEYILLDERLLMQRNLRAGLPARDVLDEYKW